MAPGTATAFRTLFSQQPEKLGDSLSHLRHTAPHLLHPLFKISTNFFTHSTTHFTLICPRLLAETFGDGEGTALNRMQLKCRPWDAPWRLAISLPPAPTCSWAQDSVFWEITCLLALLLSTGVFLAAIPPCFCHPHIREHGATGSHLQDQLLPARCQYPVLEVRMIHEQLSVRSSTH